MENKQNKIIDLGEATALLTTGYTLIKLESSNTGKHKLFVFESKHPDENNPNTADDILSLYNRRKLQVDAHSFYKAGKELKNRIHEHNELEVK
jgi:hypothetical protein